jgi:hypothetical protein
MTWHLKNVQTRARGSSLIGAEEGVHALEGQLMNMFGVLRLVAGGESWMQAKREKEERGRRRQRE